VGVAQLTSPAAGDKILGAISAFATMAGLPLSTEDIGGEKLYSATVDGISFGWGRSGDLLLGGIDATAVKAAFGKVKSPGASFADKLGSPLAKELVSDKASSGCSSDLGALFSWLADQPYASAEDRVLFTRLGAAFGAMTLKMGYSDGGLACTGELILK
jgi:hypothetical protein